VGDNDASGAPRRRLPTTDPVARSLSEALLAGDVAGLRALLVEDPGLAGCLLEDARGNCIAPLHLFADAPGHRARPGEIVSALAEAGADVDAAAVGSWHVETALHWAASNDDVALIDPLLDAGADIERAGSSIAGGPPMQSAVGYGQWAAVRWLAERGGTVDEDVAAVRGMVDELTTRVEAQPPHSPEALGRALWNAARAGQEETGALLVENGAAVNWRAPWSGETPLDAARAAGEDAMTAWLLERGALPGDVDRVTERAASPAVTAAEALTGEPAPRDRLRHGPGPGGSRRRRPVDQG